MFDRFSQSAIRVVMLAQEEAKQLRDVRCGAEHVLLGLLGQTGKPARVMNDAGLFLKDARVAVASAPVEKPLSTSWVARWRESWTGIPFDDECQRLLENAWSEASDRRKSVVTDEELCLALLRTESKVVHKYLQNHNVNLDELRHSLLQD